MLGATDFASSTSILRPLSRLALFAWPFYKFAARFERIGYSKPSLSPENTVWRSRREGATLNPGDQTGWFATPRSGACLTRSGPGLGRRPQGGGAPYWSLGLTGPGLVLARSRRARWGGIRNLESWRISSHTRGAWITHSGIGVAG